MLRAGAVFVATILMVAASGSAAFAQAAPARPGITVIGRGAVRRPADVARFAISLSNRQTSGPAFSGPDQLVEALRKAGVADAAVSTPYNNMVTAQAFVSVVGSLHKPTPERVRALVASVEASLPPNGIAIQSIQFALSLDDCTDAESIATRAAMDDARQRAQRAADAAHVELAAPLAIADLNGFGACPTKPDALPFGNQQPYDPFQSGSLDVLIAVNLNVTFGIR
jgi:uncharacterized protein YggE